MKPIKSNRERGVALLALLAAIMLSASWFLVKQLNTESSGLSAVKRSRNAEVLSRAKQALIGYVAMTAATAGDRNPGRLPCPEHAWYIGIPDKEGIMGPSVGVPSPGFGSTDCASIGRLPWRTLGLDKLVDTASEPLWYVVGPSWRLTSSTSTLLINSNTPSGDITIDGQQTVALIVAPGEAINAQMSAGCTARNQTRSAPSPTMEARDYIECFDSVTLQFITTTSSTSFNDQVVRITVADIMPAIEAAIAQRIEREIVPLLNGAYTAPNWGLTGTDIIYPFAVLTVPLPNPNTSNFTGSAATTQGFLPVVHSETFPTSGLACTADASDPRCDPTLVQWADASPSISYIGAGVTLSSTCTYAGPTDNASCNGTYTGAPTQITVSGPQTNGAMALRQINSSATGSITWQDLTTSISTSSNPLPSVRMNSDGTLTVSLSATPPAPAGVAGVKFSILVPSNATSDHAVLDTRTSSSTGWFLRNEWHKVIYYAVAPAYTASAAAPRACSDTAPITCLQVTNLTNANKQRAIIALAGRKLSGQARPGTSLADYFDVTENQNGDAIFIKMPVNGTFNDRFISVNRNP